MFDRVRWNEKQLGIWWKSYKAVGTKGGKDTFTKKNLAPKLLIGLHLIWANLWFDLSYGVKTFEIKNND